MKAVVAIDSFKGSLSSSQAGKAAADGIIRVYPDAKVEICVLADGGEGTMEALMSGMNGKNQCIFVTDPLGKKTVCEYGIAEDGKTAIMEMASAAGITLIKKEERNPLFTTTYGVGEMILDAIKKGCTKFLIGIGGSATNDGGVGMLQALGYGFLDQKGNQVSFGAQGLEKIERITDEGVIPELKRCHFTIACDVTNPLCGPEGCSIVYGPQKGADSYMAEQMDRWMEKYADIVERSFTKADRNYPGTGADCLRRDGNGEENKRGRHCCDRRRTAGRTDSDGESAGWHCKAGKEISKTSDCFFWQCCRGSEKV